MAVFVVNYDDDRTDSCRLTYTYGMWVLVGVN